MRLGCVLDAYRLPGRGRGRALPRAPLGLTTAVSWRTIRLADSWSQTSDRRKEENRVPATKDAVRVRIGKKRQITLPEAAAARLGVGVGDELEARILDDRIELIPMVAVPRDQAWFWTPDWQAKEREAEAARRAGDYAEFKTAGRLVAALKKKKK